MARRRQGRYLKARREPITIIDPSNQYNQRIVYECDAIFSIYAPTSRAHFETDRGFAQFDRVSIFTINHVLPKNVIDECVLVRNNVLEEGETVTSLKSNRKRIRIIGIQRARKTSRIICRDNET